MGASPLHNVHFSGTLEIGVVLYIIGLILDIHSSVKYFYNTKIVTVVTHNIFLKRVTTTFLSFTIFTSRVYALIPEYFFLFYFLYFDS